MNLSDGSIQILLGITKWDKANLTIFLFRGKD